MLVHSSREAGWLQESEERLLHRVFDFSDSTAEAIMQPRVEVDAVDLQSPLAEVLASIAANHHSRYPVYEDSIDNVVGVLHTKDLLDALVARPELLVNRELPFDFKPLLRKPLFVPSTLPVDRLLERMQQTKTHLAILMDEYGGMAGVATMEDIIEQLVGDVQDEFDMEEASVILGVGDVAVVDGLTTIHDAIDRFGDPGLEVESMTIGGYVAERLNRIPTLHDKVDFGDYDVFVQQMDGMRVSRVRFVKQPVKPDQTDADGNESNRT
ncbi:MAG TPA: hemolysin family protein, partial [Phototrophicaceae bacterium]|nr:hemolysin family protein [Phototrophicaceae bacterium]